MATKFYIKALIRYPTTTKVVTGFANFAFADVMV